MQTTYFARAKNLDPSLNLVSIARRTPPGFPGRVFLELAPPEELLWRTKESGDFQAYTLEFNEMLSKLDPNKVAEELGEDAIIVCYEGEGKFCHRHLVAMWLMTAGYVTSELRV
jgi:hypothetical protein